jgi:hypothetical protein
MLWVTRWKIRVNRAATGWLVRRFVDPGASFQFVHPLEVVRLEREQGAVGFDAPDARYPHRDQAGRCSFEALVDEYRPYDAALNELARIVHHADFPGDMNFAETRSRIGSFDVLAPSLLGQASSRGAEEAVGLRAISRGFPFVANSDHETLERSAFLYDSLYASLWERLRA